MRDRLRKAFSQFLALAQSRRAIAMRWAKATAVILTCLTMFCTGLYLGLWSALKVAVFPRLPGADNAAPGGTGAAPPAGTTDDQARSGTSSTTTATVGKTSSGQSGAGPAGQGSNPGATGTPPVEPEASQVTLKTKTLAEILKGLSLPVEGQILRKEGWYYLEAFSEWRYHRGIDFKAPGGHPVKAPLEGTVKDVYRNVQLGTVVVLSHEGDVETLYGCITPGEDIVPGRKVVKGEVLGYISDSGPREGDAAPHLHFEVHFRGELVASDRYLGTR
ncbi:MAG: M23 family metallopeptidase [Firmicutes bacterium]|nr:M23 family metallopeptidase [Candidatus Fermentithermobacillaceae bacterium]